MPINVDPTTPRFAVLLAAAGLGKRLGAAVPKAFVDISGISILERAVQGALAVPRVTEVIVIVAADRVAEAQKILSDASLLGNMHGRTVSVVVGGAERVDSVRCGLNATSAEFVLVHDSARAFTPPVVYDRVINALLEGHAGVIPGLPVTDTIKRVNADNVVVDTPPRAELVAVQTPQGFPAQVLRRAYEHLDANPQETVTDDASLVEAAGWEVVVVPGDAAAMKVTVPDDIVRAQRLRAQEMP